ncbi:MAG TPA: hypothetical protein VNT30_17795 [Stellaceae bacterium]|nr:hypothetical protein [Stellaceae bacterium]
MDPASDITDLPLSAGAAERGGLALHTAVKTSVQWQLAAIDEGIRAADAGRVVAHDEVVRWVLSWGSPNELPMPCAQASGGGDLPP